MNLCRKDTEKQLEKLVEKASRIQNTRGKYSNEDARRTLEDPSYGFSQDIIEEVLRGDNYSRNKNKAAKKEKVKPEKLERRLLEEVIKSNLGSVGNAIKKIGKVITYPTIGVNFLLPTMIRKAGNLDEDFLGYLRWTISPLGFCIGNAIIYYQLYSKNAKAIPYVLGTQLLTNFLSGGYEFIHKVRKDMKERRGELLSSD